MWVSHLESVQSDGVCVDVVRLRTTFQDEAAERSQGVFAHFQGVEGQWVRFFVLVGLGDDVGRTVSCPVGHFERKRLADVLHDAAVRGQAQGADEAAVLPHREREPVHNAVHGV